MQEEVDQKTIALILNAGDSTVIEKDFPHICKNTGDVTVKGISAISPPVWGRMDLVR